MTRFANFLRFVGLGLVFHAATVSADDGLPPPPMWMDPTDAMNPVSQVRGAGIKVGEGTIFQPQLGLETGVVSNVFYQNTGAVTAGLLRLLIEVGTGSLPNQRLGPQAAAGPAGPLDMPGSAPIAYSDV